MPEAETLQAYRSISVPIDLGGGRGISAQVPFDVDLLERVEETLRRAHNKPWYVLKPSQERILAAYEDFCRPYLPADLDLKKVDPTFCALFFSHVRGELMRSIGACVKSMTSTGE